VPVIPFPGALAAILLALLAPQGVRPLPSVADLPDALRVPAPLPQVAEITRPPFSDWLAELRKEALSKGISERTVEAALGNLEPLPIVVERDRTQAERVLPLDEYLKRKLNKKFVNTARQRLREQAAVLARVSGRYGVPSAVIVAVWGLESNFGRFSGVRPTIASLATLAYDNRRAALFREELFDALRIVDRGDVPIEQMKGSWAGAMGQPQFMPSSYLRFARDFDEDGRTDIWGSLPDVFASIANFLKEHGWRAGGAWGRRAKVPAVAAAKLESEARFRTEGCEAVRQMTEPLPLSRWRALGLRLEGRGKAPAATTPASLVRAGSQSFLVFDNYQSLLQYNCAQAYALSVALLSDQLKTKK
jgi:membrane-bound lytic murein transglycosylase B